jgi:3-oxoacyl-[acyl-carrier-protein] synthase-3
MRPVYLSDVAYAVGELRETVEEAAARGALFSSAAALRDSGFEWHHYCGPATTSYDLARRAVAGLAGDPAAVDAIAYACCIPANANVGDPRAFAETGDVKPLMDYPASRLQADLGMDRAIVLGITQQACTGMFGAIRVARALLCAEPELRRIVCLTADRFPEGARYEQAYNLISDGAAACVVTAEPSPLRVVGCHHITNGAMATASDDETVGQYFGYSRRLVDEALARAGLALGEIDWILPQNVNATAVKVLARLLRCDPERLYLPSLATVGHMISGDNLVNLAHLLRSGRLERGDRILLFLAGYGLNYQSLILERE